MFRFPVVSGPFGRGEWRSGPPLEFWQDEPMFQQADETQAGIKRLPLRMPDSLTGRFFPSISLDEL
jgi:hypothetical protein